MSRPKPAAVVEATPADVAPQTSQTYSEYYASRRPSQAAHGVIYTWHARLLEALIARVPGMLQMRVLEVGSGWGYFGRACRARGIEYLGIELNPEQAARLREDGLDVSVAEVPPFPPGRPVQLIYMSHVLEHATSYLHALAMLTAARERLDERGYIALVCPDLLSWGPEFWGVDWSHGFPTTLRRLQQIVAESGFEIVDARYHTAGFTSPPLVFAATQLMRLIPVNAIDAVLQPLTKRSLAYSFMTIFGWRQLLVIGRKK